MKLRIEKLSPFGVVVEPKETGADYKELPIESLRPIFQKEHLVVLRGFQDFSNQEQYVEFCERWGEISLWPFGKVLELIEQKNPEDHIFDHNYVPLHWDGMYRPQVPEMQIFHCVLSPGKDQGGRTTFSNTTQAYANASPREIELWSRARGTYERKMEFYHSKTVAPVVVKHPTRGFPVLRFCEPPQANDETFVNHPTWAFTGVSETETSDLLGSLHEALYSPKNFYAHTWQTGDVVLADNYTLLHGREAFTSGAPRHLRRVHVLGQTPLDNPHLVFHS